MSINENQSYVYVRNVENHNKWDKVPCTEEFKKSYYSLNGTYRKKQQRHKRCWQPRAEWYKCDSNCFECKYHLPGDLPSLDEPVIDETGEEQNRIDLLQDKTPSTEENLSNQSEYSEMLEKIAELMPKAIEIGKYRDEGLTDTAIAELIGVGRKTFAYQLKKLKNQIESEYPEFFK